MMLGGMDEIYASRGRGREEWKGREGKIMWGRDSASSGQWVVEVESYEMETERKFKEFD